VSLPLVTSQAVRDAAVNETAEISVKGKWIRVPALDIGGNKLIVRGKWLKMAIVLDEEWQISEVGDPALCVQALKEHPSRSLRADIFTFVQKPPATAPRYEYFSERESVAVTSTTSFKDWWEKLPQETRKNVRRSQRRGVTVRLCQLDDELVKGLVDLNNDSPLRQGRPYVHYGKSLEEVKKDQLSFLDHSDLIGAYFGEELVGFLKLVYRGETASILTFLPKASHYDKRPANALIAKAVELCESKGISCLTYGLFNYGNKGDCSARVFKTRNGFEEMLVPRFYIPLTLKGRICLKLNLHRGLLGIIPHDLIALGVNLRYKWYNLKQLISRHSLMVEQPRL
jgi:hypothetical protein